MPKIYYFKIDIVALKNTRILKKCTNVKLKLILDLTLFLEKKYLKFPHALYAVITELDGRIDS